MVARVDEFLKQKLGRPLGLADANVYVLDPGCGTGTFLLETLRVIHDTLKKNPNAMTEQQVKVAATSRVFGFELLPAPFIISHLQLGLFLSRIGAPLANGKERVAVYLTNSLTGWDEGSLPALPWPELEDERTGSGIVKKKTPIIVIIGNPPYNSKPKKGETDVFFSAAEKISPSITSKVYKKGLSTPKSKGGWGIRKSTLDDLYIRFLRLAERKIVEKSVEAGLICYITNFSFLSGPSYVVMRRRFLEEFSEIWIDSMNGDSRETGKVTPEGAPDPSVFSTASNKQGIRVGTAISLLLKHAVPDDNEAVVRYKDFWGSSKRTDLLSSLTTPDLSTTYQVATPSMRNRFSFRSGVVSLAYASWPDITELTSEQPFNGPIERRGNSLIVFPWEKAKLKENLAFYLDKDKSDEAVAEQVPKFMKSSGEFDAASTRQALLAAKLEFQESNIRPYCFKPFDTRLVYLDPKMAPLFSRPSPELIEHAKIEGNTFFITRDTADKSPEGPPFYISNRICDYDFISGHARHFPLLFRFTGAAKRKKAKTKSLTFEYATDQEKQPEIRPNLSSAAAEYLQQLAIVRDDTGADLLLNHMLANRLLTTLPEREQARP